jgi:hypothetical protein
VFNISDNIIPLVMSGIVLVASGVVIASAVIPTFIAQKWFMPAHSEAIIELNGNGDGKAAAQ